MKNRPLVTNVEIVNYESKYKSYTSVRERERERERERKRERDCG